MSLIDDVLEVGAEEGLSSEKLATAVDVAHQRVSSEFDDMDLTPTQRFKALNVLDDRRNKAILEIRRKEVGSDIVSLFPDPMDRATFLNEYDAANKAAREAKKAPVYPSHYETQAKIVNDTISKYPERRKFFGDVEFDGQTLASTVGRPGPGNTFEFLVEHTPGLKKPEAPGASISVDEYGNAPSDRPYEDQLAASGEMSGMPAKLKLVEEPKREFMTKSVEVDRPKLIKESEDKIARLNKDLEHAKERLNSPYGGAGDSDMSSDVFLVPTLERDLQKELKTLDFRQKRPLAELAQMELTSALKDDEQFKDKIPNNWVEQFTTRPLLKYIQGQAQMTASLERMALRPVFQAIKDNNPYLGGTGGVADVVGGELAKVSDEVLEYGDAAGKVAPGALENRFENKNGMPLMDMVAQGEESLLAFLGPGLVQKVGSKVLPMLGKAGQAAVLGQEARNAAAGVKSTLSGPAGYSSFGTSAFGNSYASRMQAANEVQKTDPAEAERIRFWAPGLSFVDAIKEVGQEMLIPGDMDRLLLGGIKGTIPQKLGKVTWGGVAEGLEEVPGAMADEVLQFFPGSPEAGSKWEAFVSGLAGSAAFAPSAFFGPHIEPMPDGPGKLGKTWGYNGHVYTDRADAVKAQEATEAEIKKLNEAGIVYRDDALEALKEVSNKKDPTPADLAFGAKLITLAPQLPGRPAGVSVADTGTTTTSTGEGVAAEDGALTPAKSEGTEPGGVATPVGGIAPAGNLVENPIPGAAVNSQFAGAPIVPTPIAAPAAAIAEAPAAVVSAAAPESKRSLSDFGVQPSSDDITEVAEANGLTVSKKNENAPLSSLSGGVDVSQPAERKRVDALKEKIIGEGGHVVRLIVDADGRVVEGQHRLTALQELGFDAAPVVRLTGVDDHIPDAGAVHEVLKSVKGLSSDNRNRMVANIAEILSDEGGNAEALLEYEAPAGAEKQWDAAVAEVIRQKQNAPAAPAPEVAPEAAPATPEAAPTPAPAGTQLAQPGNTVPVEAPAASGAVVTAVPEGAELPPVKARALYTPETTGNPPALTVNIRHTSEGRTYSATRQFTNEEDARAAMSRARQLPGAVVTTAAVVRAPGIDIPAAEAAVARLNAPAAQAVAPKEAGREVESYQPKAVIKAEDLPEPMQKNLADFRKKVPGGFFVEPGTTTLKGKLLDQISKVTGARIIGFHGRTSATGKRTEGFVIDGDPNTIYLNMDATQPMLHILGHEWYHTREHMPQFKAFVAEMKKLEPALWEANKNKGTLAKSESEFMADVVGTRWSDPEFWRRAQQQMNPGVWRSFVEFLRNIWKNLKAGFSERAEFVLNAAAVDRMLIRLLPVGATPNTAATGAVITASEVSRDPVWKPGVYNNGWLSTDGTYSPLVGGESHLMFAQRKGETRDSLYDKGWMRVTGFGSEALVVNNNSGKNLTPKQRAAIEDASESTGKKVFFEDGRNRLEVVWDPQPGGEIIPSEVTVTLEQDAAYAQAVASGDVAGAQAMVDAAAKASGLTERLFRGFQKRPRPDKFVTRQGRATVSLTPVREVANLYSHIPGMIGIKQGDGATVHQYYVDPSNYADIRSLGTRDNLENILTAGTSWNFYPDEKSKKKSKFGVDQAIDLLDELYAMGGHNSEITAGGRGGFVFSNLLEASEYLNELRWNQKKDPEGDDYVEDVLAVLGGIEVEVYRVADTQAFTEAVKANGKNGIIHRDTVTAGASYFGRETVAGRPVEEVEGIDAEDDFSHDTYRPFEMNQMKLADPATYDDAGNLIPLSQRFQPTSPDIRFSEVPAAPEEEVPADTAAAPTVPAAPATPIPTAVDEEPEPAEAAPAPEPILDDLGNPADLPNPDSMVFSEVDAPAYDPTISDEDRAGIDAGGTSGKVAAVKYIRDKYGLGGLRMVQTEFRDDVLWAAQRRLNTNPFAGNRLMEEIRKRPRVLGTIEQAILMLTALDLQQRSEEATSDVNAAAARGDDGAAGDAMAELARVNTTLRELMDIHDQTGTLAGRALNFRKYLLQRDYTWAAMERDWMASANQGGPLDGGSANGPQRRLLQQMHKKLEDAQERIAELENFSLDAAVEKELAPILAALDKTAAAFGGFTTEKTYQAKLKVTTAKTDKIGADFFKNLNAPVTTTVDGVTTSTVVTMPEDVRAALAMSGVGVLEGGATEFEDFKAEMISKFSDGVVPYLDNLFAAAKLLQKRLRARHKPVDVPASPETQGAVDAQKDIAKAERALDDATPLDQQADDLTEEGEDEGPTLTEEQRVYGPHTLYPDRKLVRDTVRLHVEMGERGVNDVFNAALADLLPDYPALDLVTIKKIFSNYGNITEPSTDPVERELAELQAMARLQSGINDLRAGLPALGTGPRRSAVTQQIREAQAELNELKRRRGDTQQRANQLKGAIDAAFTRLRHEIEDLNKYIDQEGRTAEQMAGRTPATASASDEVKARLQELRDIRDALKEGLAELEGPRELTDAEKITIVERGLMRTQAALEIRLKHGPAVRDAAVEVTSDAIRQRQAYIKELRDQIKAKEAGPKKIHELEQAIIDTQAAIDRFNANVFDEQRPDPPPLEGRAAELEKELDALKAWLSTAQRKAKAPLKRVDNARKTLDRLKRIWNGTEVPTRKGLPTDMLDQEKLLRGEIKELQKLINKRTSDLGAAGRYMDSIRKAVERVDAIFEGTHLPKVRAKPALSPEQQVERDRLKQYIETMQKIIRKRNADENAPKRQLQQAQRTLERIEGILTGSRPAPDRSSVEPFLNADGTPSDELLLRGNIETAKRELAAIRAADPEMQMNKQLKATQTRIAELQTQMKLGKFEKRTPKEIAYDDVQQKKLNDARARFITVQKEWHQMKFDAALASRTKGQVAADFLNESLKLARLFQLGFDFGILLRQGGRALGRPGLMWEATRMGYNALWSKDAQDKEWQRIQSHPEYHKAIKMGLDLTDPDNILSWKREEEFQSRWVNATARTGSDPLNKLLNAPLGATRALSRGQVIAINKIRFGMWLAMNESLARQSLPSTREMQQFAKMANISTGRGTMDADIERGIGALALAYRWGKSGIEYLTLRPLWSPAWGVLTGQQSTRAGRIIAKEYARNLTGIIMLYIAWAAMHWGDDDDEWKIEWDPRSARFAKLPIGNTLVDPTAGLAQWITLLAKMGPQKMFGVKTGMGFRKTQAGRLVPVRETDEGEKPAFGEDSMADLRRFLRYKANPLIGAGISSYYGETAVGEPTSTIREVFRLAVPIQFGDIKDAMVNNGIPQGLALTAMSWFGMGIKTWEDKSFENLETEDRIFLYNHGMSIPKLKDNETLGDVLGYNKKKTGKLGYERILTEDEKMRLVQKSLPSVEKEIAFSKENLKKLPTDEKARLREISDEQKRLTKQVELIRKLVALDEFFPK